MTVEADVKLSWWWSRDDERFRGPSFSRADAIMDAWSDDPEQGAFICQAAQGAWRSDVIDGDQLAEWFDDANEEHGDPDGDAPSVCMSDEKWRALADRMNRMLKAAIQQEGLLAWGFTSQTGSEWVDIPTAWAAAEAAALVTNAAASAAHAAPVAPQPRDEHPSLPSPDNTNPEAEHG